MLKTVPIKMGHSKRQKKSKKLKKMTQLLSGLRIQEASADPPGYNAMENMEEPESPKPTRRVKRLCDGCFAYEGCFRFRACGLCRDIAVDGEPFGIRFRKR